METSLLDSSVQMQWPSYRRESSRHPSPFCSITVPKRGTSIVVLRLICGRLQCHVSGARRPRLATSAGASSLGWSLRGKTSSLMMRRSSPCMGSAAVLPRSHSNQVGRKDLTPMAVLELRHLISSRRRLWYSCPSGRHKPQSFIETKTLRFCNLDTKNFKK